ncbi:MAG TPA: PspC domain-containing protein [bacterium]|jgi:phage shock protein C
METAARRLTRSRRNRVFAGVCGGLAEYLGWDTVLVRIAYVALTLISFGAAGILLYLLAWMMIPLEDEQPAGFLADEPPRSRARATVGALLIIVGALALLDSFMPWFWHMFSFHIVVSAVLIAIGLIIIFWKNPEPAPAAVPAGASEVPHQEIPRAPSERRLMRLQQGRKIAGVCAGLGSYFGVDPTIVRLVFLALVLVGGSGLLLYIILWVVMPLEIT